ncbi:methyl-accepting chemotaxis protein [Actinoplanes ianthinogenes]|uniref:methyl-accepting chemotaxis protein n=1 Tax=Actinoplanes ianthinogenes TaxID=122358 RepID=UPI001E2CA4AE|nr:methyl-accepting chemotaxis protein [Actinoplanes ianthinogenes]
MSGSGPDVVVTSRRNGLVGGLADRRVGTKIYAAALCGAVVAAGIGWVGLGRLSTLNGDLQAMKAQHVDSSLQLSTLRGALGDGSAAMFGWAVLPAAQKAAQRSAVAAADEATVTAIKNYQELAKGSATRAAAAKDVAHTFAYFQQLRDYALFREAPPAGVSMPAGDRLSAEWTQTQQRLTASVVHLQETEDRESTAMAAEDEDAYHDARNQMLIYLAAGLALALALATVVTRLITRQLGSVSSALAAVASGDLTVPAEVHARDELGAMAAAVNTARDGLRGMIVRVTASSQTLGASTDRLGRAADRIAQSAREAAAQAEVVATAAGGVSTNVQSVAAGSEEMGASIREIASNATEAARVAGEAVGVAQNTNTTVSKLGESSAEIGNVIKTITAIAEQTNLLALNATIEAARAGEMGKGFAVVANEVKDLAQETARATEDIARRVEAIQDDTANAVAAIGEISTIIARINDYQTTIASAVEEQTATTGEMSRSVGDAAQGTAAIAGNIGGVATAAQNTTVALAEATDTATELAGIAGELQTVVAQFRV